MEFLDRKKLLIQQVEESRKHNLLKMRTFIYMSLCIQTKYT